MDSDDEEILQREETRRKDGKRYYVKRFKGCIPTRLHEKEEQALVKFVIICHKGILEPIDDPLAPKEFGPFTYRVARFYRTFLGFHTGVLDLAGRHEHRYVSLMRRWHQFLEDVVELLKHASEYQDVVRGEDGEPRRDRGGRTIPTVVFTVDPPDLKQKFEEKWRMRVRRKHHLTHIFAKVDACLADNPRPQFQARNILDLPPEIWYEVIEFSMMLDMRSLSATCRRLRQLALPYIFKTRRFAMEFKPRYPSGASETEFDLHSPGASEEEFDGDARSLATTAQQMVLEDMAFLLSRGDIATQVEDLLVVVLDDLDLKHAGWRAADDDVRDLSLPISRRLEDVIAHTPNLQTIKLSYLHLTQELMRRIFALPRLLHLELMSHQVVDQPDHDCPPSSLLNLTLSIGHEFGPSIWEILPRLVNLQWLLVHALENASRIIPPLSTLQRWNPFVTLKKACIGQLRPFEWDDLVIVFAAASAHTQSNLPLTHLKLSFTYGIPHDILQGLLLALEGSKLRHLVIDGICNVTPNLIGEIAHALPDLKSLTIYNRDGARQSVLQRTDWRCPIWEYAQQLSQFASLSHFGCNLNTRVSRLPSIIQLFEIDLAEDLGVTWDDPTETWDNPIVDVTRLLASHCPSLTSVGFHQGSFCRVNRSPSGQISVVEGGILDPQFYSPWPIVQSELQ